jgi:hypothetical protein
LSQRCRHFEQVFSFLPGNWLYLGAVCREWQALYAGMEDQQVCSFRDHNNQLVTCSSKTTLYSAAVALPETARMPVAVECGMRVVPWFLLQRIAGLYADVQTIGALRGLGMQLGDDPVHAAARSGRLSILQHMLSEHKCPKPKDLSHDAARSGNISMLKWLRAESWCQFDQGTCAAAARGRHLAALQHLRSEGCEWDTERIACDAAGSGSIEVVESLRQQQGIEIDAGVMAAAALAGQTAMCEHLRNTGCGWNDAVCEQAGLYGNLDTLRWLREHGCPWDIEEVLINAATGGHPDIIRYVIEQRDVLVDAELLMRALNFAGARNELQAALALRLHGAQWPAVLGFTEHMYKQHWSDEMVEWARAVGCTSPEIE